MAQKLNAATLKQIHEAMARAFGPSNAQTALELWQQHYSDREGYGVVNFVQENGKRLGLETNTEARRLRLAIFQALYVHDDASAGGTADTQAATRERQSGEPSVDTARAHVASVLIQKLAKESRGSGELFQEVLVEEVSNSTLDRETAYALETWDAKSDPRLPDKDAAMLRGAVTAAYIALCEDIGPAAADRALKRASSAAGELDEATTAPPSDIL